MRIQFIRSTAADRDFVAAAIRAPQFRGHYDGDRTVAGMRAGTAALLALDGVRQPAPDVAVTPGRYGGVPCETLTAPGADAGATIVYLHGGGFTRGSLDVGRGNAAQLALASGARVVAIGYRQAPEHPYPAAPTDVLCAYRALLDAGTPAKSIAVVGESSGGCLALGLAAMLDGRPAELPAGIAALSPMTDLELRGASWLYNADRDIADLETGRRLVGLYIDDARRREPVASPVHHGFGGCCPILLAIGSHETMLSDAERTATRADEAGTDVTFNVYEGMPHGFTRFDVGIATRALVDAAEWCRRLLRP